MFLNNSSIDKPKIEENLQGNLCRCTGYRPIVNAAEKLFESHKKENDPLIAEKLEFPLTGTYLFELAIEERSVLSKFNSLAKLANAEISVCLTVLSSSSIFFFGTVSASTKLSTI